jgi:hypothetical protein
MGLLNALYDGAAAVPHFVGFQTTTCQITANFIHPNDARALTNQKIVVYSNNLGIKKKVGDFITGNPITGSCGKITFNHTFVKYPFQSNQTLIFQIFEESLTSESKWYNPADENLVFTSIQTLPIGDQIIKDVEVDLYEFIKGFPRYKVPDDVKNMPQHWDLVDYYRIVTAAVSGKATKAMMDLFEVFYGPLSLAQIKRIMNVEKPEVTLCEDVTLDILMNGIYPDLRKIEENVYYSEVSFDGLEFQHENDLPNGHLFAFKDMNGKMHIKKINLQYRGEKFTEHLPSDENFKDILFVYNSLALTKGSCRKHLGMHFKMEEFAVAIGRHLNINPVGVLLKPFFRGVIQINQQALSVIINALKQSGLTEKGIWKDLEDEVRTNCWSTFKLHNPLCDAHGFAKASKLFYQITDEIVEIYFKQNLKGISTHWYEIKEFSDFLVENSLPMNDRDVVLGLRFFDEFFRSFRPITNSLMDPAQVDINNLKAFCKYAIFQVTWGHWTLHISEKIGLNPDVARFALNNVDPEQLTEFLQIQIALGKTLTNFEEGTIVDNPNHDIEPQFIDRLTREDVLKIFAECGFDGRKILYGTII